jgi:hypothetical protein
LGLVHGHFDVPNLNEDVVTDTDSLKSGVHTGIGVVIPVEKIVETINHPDLVSMRKKRVQEIRESGATPDLVADDDIISNSTDEKPTHREDFRRLVDVAARKQKQDD